LEHPGIIPIYEFDQKADGKYFYVMKHVHGKTLATAINECFSEDPKEFF